MSTDPTSPPNMANAWGLEPGTMVRFKNESVHRFRSISSLKLENGKRLMFFDGLTEPIEVAWDYMVEIIEEEPVEDDIGLYPQEQDDHCGDAP